MAANDVFKKWVAKDGSIFVAEPEGKKFEHQKKAIPVQALVAANVGNEMAKHIVNFHNKWIDDQNVKGNAHTKCIEIIMRDRYQ